MTKYKTYKYLIKPTISQKEIIQKILSCCTYVYNRFIEEDGFVLYKNVLAKDILAKYKSENEFLFMADPSALMNVLFVLQDNRITRNATKHNKYLKSYTTSNLSGRQAIYFIDNKYINIPRLGNVSISKYRDLPQDAKIVKATITRDNIDNYYVCISFSYESTGNNNTLDITKSIGLDYSSKYLFISSNGEKGNMERFYKKQKKRISTLKRVLAKCDRNSNNYKKIRYKIAKIYKRSANQRNDFLHKLSRELANKYDVICIEDLEMKEIAKHYHLSKNTYENSYGKFVELLKYKLEEQGKILITIDKYYPSSKMCHVCGYINIDLKLSDREWICPQCHTYHDRDLNSAINIKNRGIQEFTSIGYLDKAYRIGSIPH